MTTIEATVEGGIFRPVKPIDLPEGTRVELVIIVKLADARSPTAILDEIAAMPIQGKTDPFSGEDHDRVLYG